MKAEFHDYLDTLFCAQLPVIAGAGEDSFLGLRQDQSALVAVFDGCGGLGAAKYPGFQDHTGAYMASRLACGAVHDWYRAHGEDEWKTPRQLLESLDSFIRKGLEFGGTYGNSRLRIRGSMVRDFPSTIALALARQEGGVVAVYLVWAGDSRVYLLNDRGLSQLTTDDSEVTDAFENLTSDGELTNLLSSDGKYSLHCKRLKLGGPALIFAATDGCFGYIPSPMEFEYTICKAIVDAGTVKDLQEGLRQEFRKTAGDDFALCGMSLGYGDYEAIRKMAGLRAEALENGCLRLLKQDRTAAEDLWQDYRRNYERHL